MKRVLLLLVSCMYFVPPTEGQWRKTFSFDSGQNIFTIKFASLAGPPRIGFATGHPLWRTTDGELWQKVEINSFTTSTDVCFLDSTTGLLSNGGGWPTTPSSYKTTDAGVSWFPLYASGFGSATAIHYNDSSNLLFLGVYDSVMRVSSDLGWTWRSSSVLNVSSFSFSSPSHGIAFAGAILGFDIHGNPYWVDSLCAMYVTSDGGTSWERSKQFNTADTIADAGVGQPLAVPNTSTCFAVHQGSFWANQDSGAPNFVVLRSDDYGMNWHQVCDKYIGLHAGGSVISGTLDRLVVATDSGFFVSTDEGVTWNNHHGPTGVLNFYNDKGKTIAAGLMNGGDFGIWEEDWATSHVKPIVDAGSLPSYPNPTHDRITLDLEAPATYEIRDMLGAIRLRGRAEAAKATLDVSSLPAGVYYISSGSTRARFVKE